MDHPHLNGQVRLFHLLGAVIALFLSLGATQAVMLEVHSRQPHPSGVPRSELQLVRENVAGELAGVRRELELLRTEITELRKERK